MGRGLLRTSSPVAPQLPLTDGLAQRPRAARRYHPELQVFQPKMIQDNTATGQRTKPALLCHVQEHREALWTLHQ